MLSDRRQKVLRALIEEYVERALPVGSRTLTEHYDLGVSAATVRNELSALEEGGYISQPHTSSGRVPTDYGYRTFVDSIIATDTQPKTSEYTHLVKQIREYATQLDDLMEETSALLARLTDCLSIVVAPTTQDLVIKQITLVCMNAKSVMLVVVTQDGQVLNRHMQFENGVSSDSFAPCALTPDTLAAIQQFLNEKLAGKSLSDLKSGLHEIIVDTFCKKYAEGAYIEAFMNEIKTCLQSASQDAIGHHTHRLGLSSLMSQPEFSHSSALVPIMQVLEDETVLLELLDAQDLSANGSVNKQENKSDTEKNQTQDTSPVVTIGMENSSFGLPGVSVVAGKYGRGNSAGVVAVIGPTRMNYSKVISAVRLATQALRDD